MWYTEKNGEISWGDDMNLNNLRCFLDVVDAGTISQAARNTYTSQQALSDQIRRLEKHFQTPLLERTNPLRLTPAGELVCKAAQEVLGTMEHLERQVARIREPAHRLVISTGLARTPPFLPKIIARFQELEPKVEVHLVHPSSLNEERDSPLPGADLIVGNMPFASDIEEIPLFQDVLSLAVSEELLHKVYGGDWLSVDLILRERATLQTCKELPVVSWGLDSHPSRQHKLGDFERPMLDSMEMNTYRCRAGMVAAVYPNHYAHEIFGRDPHMHIYPLYPPRVAFQVGIGVRKGEPQKDAVKKFIQVAKDCFLKEVNI